MTERTPAETVEAVADLLERDRIFLPDHLTAADAYLWAIFKVRACALTMRLSTPPVPSGHTHCPGCDTELVSGMCPLCGFRPLLKPAHRARAA